MKFPDIFGRRAAREREERELRSVAEYREACEKIEREGRERAAEMKRMNEARDRLTLEEHERRLVEAQEQDRRIAAEFEAAREELSGFCKPGDRFEYLGIIFVCSGLDVDRGRLFLGADCNVAGEIVSWMFYRADLPAMRAERDRARAQDVQRSHQIERLEALGFTIIPPDIEVAS